MNGEPVVAARPSAHTPTPHRHAPKRKVRCRNYIKYPSPQGLRPRAGGPFKVADLCAAYNFPTGLAGGGVIGILELSGPDPRYCCGYTQADLDRFSQLNGLPQLHPTDVSVNGGQNKPGEDGDGEVLLDIQVAAAAYFYCTGHLPAIKVFFAPNDAASFAAVMREAVAAGCDVLSISWGSDEPGWIRTTRPRRRPRPRPRPTAVVSCSRRRATTARATAAPGQTSIYPPRARTSSGVAGPRRRHSPKRFGATGPRTGGELGGGCSVLFPPQDWQIDAPPSPGQSGRMVPDVAADADPDTGYLVVINGQEVQIGGTSAVAPLYSGLFAAFGRKLGFVTPKLWQNSDAFMDITQGSNGSFQAAPGPDPCTGLGVPIGTALAALFAATAPSAGARASNRSGLSDAKVSRPRC